MREAEVTVLKKNARAMMSSRPGVLRGLPNRSILSDMRPTPEQRRYGRLFHRVANPENWKNPTKPISFSSKERAEAMQRAIIFFTGGATLQAITRNGRTRYTVSSKGYYRYIGT